MASRVADVQRGRRRSCRQQDPFAEQVELGWHGADASLRQASPGRGRRGMPRGGPSMHIPNESALLRRVRRRTQDRAADAITRFAGSMLFVYLHVGWFALWVLYNAAAPRAFDRFPFGLLTLIVSLEAIFLSTFVMISQNREAQRSEIRAQLDFETNVLGEVWVEMIAAKLGIDVREVHEKVADRMAAAKSRQSAVETRGAMLTGDPTLDTQYLHSGVDGKPQQPPSPS